MAICRKLDSVGERQAYVVSMFPYPSGDLHMGHAEVYSIGDAVARYRRLRGELVLHPVGWDSFGLPAENAARKRGLDPREWTYANIEVQAESFRRMRFSFDWSTRLHTSDPSFFRWTQWVFLRLFEAGLAYRAQAPVNWCPSDATVLANEQVIGGRCERCGTPVVQRELTQWFLRTTAYAQRLIDDMSLIAEGWPPEVLTMQRHWIGGLHDWLISRQRRWGTPIPIVHCVQCGLVPAAELPVALDLPRDKICPRCGTPAQWDPDTMDTFVDSSWYFLRYPNVSYVDGPFDPAQVTQVDEYFGGRDHATGHLIYARFMTKALHDLGLIDFVEPFRRLTCPGQVILHGKSMSKSLGNLVSLREELDEHGPDAVRVAILFAGPPEQDLDWADVSPAAAAKWLARVRRLTEMPVAAQGAPFHDLVHEITKAMDARRFNVAIARLMELTTRLRRSGPTRDGLTALLSMLSCFAPITAADCLGATLARWPDLAAPRETTTTCVVEVDGKVKARLNVPVGIAADELEALARNAIGDITASRVIVRPPRVVNFLR
jgi:leucyl-tRNA synthetase